MTDDSQLLQEFVRTGAQDAFSALAQRHVNLIYSAAIRQVGGDAHLAWDVTQGVFLALAQNAPRLASRPTLTGWLYTATRFVAAKIVRTRQRAAAREIQAHTMNAILRDDMDGAAEPAWHELQGVLDSVMHTLDERERDALLLRHFEGRSYAEVGALCGITENAARMRVERALDRLRVQLSRRGITSTAAALGSILAARSVSAAPAGLAAAATSTSLAAAAIGGGGTLVAAWCIIEFMQTTKLALALVGAVAAIGLGAFLGTQYRATNLNDSSRASLLAQQSSVAALQEENRRLKEEARRHLAASGMPTPHAAGLAANPPSAPALDQIRVLTDLQKKQWVNAQMTFVDRDGKITPSFAGLFNLTPSEHDALQATVERTRTSLAELERANATVTQEADGKVMIRVKAFAEQGGHVYNDLMRDFASTLGPERDEAYRSLGAEQVEQAFGTVRCG